MKLDSNRNQIIITEIPNNIDPTILYQLRNVWQFQETEDKQSLIHDLQEGDDLFERVLNYLNQEGISVTTTSAFQQLQSDYNEQKERFRGILRKCEDYKNGIFDENAANVFNQYLNSLPRTLRSHQVNAALHQYFGTNTANFSVPGAGKTSVVLSVYEKLRRENKTNLLFVVGPTACFFPWQTEFEQTLGRTPNSTVLAGQKISERQGFYYLPVPQRPELYLISFDTLKNDISHVLTMFTMIDSNVYMVVDEGHYIKSLNGKRANAVLTIAKHAKYRCVLTGTPIPHSYPDLYNLFDYLWPEENPLDKHTRTKIELMQSNSNNDEAKELIDKKIGPLFYRVRKSDLGLGPQIFNEPILIPMNPVENKIYNYILDKIRHDSLKDYMREQDVLEKLIRGRLMRLRQTATYSKLLDTALDESDLFNYPNSELLDLIINYDEMERPAKLETLLSMLTKYKEDNLKVVIWTNFVRSLKLILNKIEELGLNAKGIWGDIPRADSISQKDESIGALQTRESIRNEFVDPTSGLDILVAIPAACAEAISLHKTCWNAIYYDLSYNCAQYLQSLDRIHRVGGSEDKEVNYYFLQYENSIDQAILENLNIKKERMYQLIEKDYSIYSLDMEDKDGDNDIEINIYNSIIKKK